MGFFNNTLVGYLSIAVHTFISDTIVTTRTREVDGRCVIDDVFHHVFPVSRSFGISPSEPVRRAGTLSEFRIADDDGQNANAPSKRVAISSAYWKTCW